MTAGGEGRRKGEGRAKGNVGKNIRNKFPDDHSHTDDELMKVWTNKTLTG